MLAHPKLSHSSSQNANYEILLQIFQLCILLLFFFFFNQETIFPLKTHFALIPQNPGGIDVRTLTLSTTLPFRLEILS